MRRHTPRALSEGACSQDTGRVRQPDRLTMSARRSSTDPRSTRLAAALVDPRGDLVGVEPDEVAPLDEGDPSLGDEPPEAPAAQNLASARQPPQSTEASAPATPPFTSDHHGPSKASRVDVGPSAPMSRQRPIRTWSAPSPSPLHHREPCTAGHHELLDQPLPPRAVTPIARTRLQPLPGCVPREGAVAWLRMMGVDSVEYHRRTVLGRGDDFEGRAVAYCGSRG